MSLTFYYAPFSTASTVHWTLEELGIPYEAVRVDLKDAADKANKLGPLNPNLKVPVLVHGGTPIFESAAIQAYLGETFGVDKGLYPKAGPARGEALKWLVWANVTLVEAIGRWQRNVSEWVPAEQRNAAAGAAARKDIDTLLATLDKELATKPHMLGDEISIVDFHLASVLEWAQHCGVVFEPFPKVAAWLSKCTKRPANAKANQA